MSGNQRAQTTTDGIQNTAQGHSQHDSRPGSQQDAQHSAAAQCTDLPTTGQTLVVTDVIISVDTAMWVKIEEQTTGNVIWGPHYFPANSGPMQFTPRGKLKHSTANKYFQVITSVAGNITCDLYYFSEP